MREGYFYWSSRLLWPARARPAVSPLGDPFLSLASSQFAKTPGAPLLGSATGADTQPKIVPSRQLLRFIHMLAKGALAELIRLIAQKYSHPPAVADVFRECQQEDSSFDINKVYEQGKPLLYIAAQHGRTDMVKQLLLCGASLDNRTKDGATILHAAAAWGHTETVQWILERRRDLLEARDIVGVSPLHLAARYNHVKTMRCLFEYGADPNSMADGKWTALHGAARGCRKEAIECLLSHPRMNTHNARCHDGNTALHLLVFASSKSWLPSKADLLRLFFKDNKTDLAIKNARGQTPAKLAAKLYGRRAPIVHLLRMARLGTSNKQNTLENERSEASLRGRPLWRTDHLGQSRATRVLAHRAAVEGSDTAPQTISSALRTKLKRSLELDLGSDIPASPAAQDYLADAPEFIPGLKVDSQGLDEADGEACAADAKPELLGPGRG